MFPDRELTYPLTTLGITLYTDKNIEFKLFGKSHIEISFILVLEPYTPYNIEVSAATSVGKGELSPITFFTVEGGQLYFTALQIIIISI